MTESPTGALVLEVEHLCIGFETTAGAPADAGLPRAADDVSFTIERGRVLALVGESGSGKTVTARAILGLLPATAYATGSVRLRTAAGAPLHEVIGASTKTWRGVRGSAAAMVFQEPQTALNPVKTVGWQLAEAVRAHQDVSRKQARARAVELLALVGIDEPNQRVDAYPHQLSGGQKQRVVIAMALANDPALLIADEPTTALDVTVQTEILALLADLRRRLGTAILLITHNMGVVADLADEVLVMRNGRIVEHGDVVSLFSSPITDYTRHLLGSVPRLPVVEEMHADADRPAVRVSHRASAAVDQKLPPTADTERPADARPELALQFRDATIEYPGRLGRPGFRALSDVDLQLERGRVLGVVGESGSGKTTLVKAGIGNVRTSSGQVLVGGVDLAHVGRTQLKRLRRGLGVVHQDPATSLDPLLRVGDSIAEPLQVHGVASGKALRARVRELLASVSLPAGYEERLPGELSGGQRQRIALARALALQPGLLIADEPTSALDVSVQASILALFADLQAELGFACVFVSHDLAVVNQVSDDVLVMRHGRVVEAGPTEQVLRRPASDYTRDLLDAIPLPDPVRQRNRRTRQQEPQERQLRQSAA